MKPFLTAFFLCCSFSASAEADFNRIIKAQQDVDKSTRHENIPVKKDVYSSIEKPSIDNMVLPKEKICISIHEVVIENDFLKDKNIKALTDKAAGSCLGSAGVRKIAIDLQDYFIHSGYLTTRIDVPEQNLATGRLRLKVEAGKIGKIIIEGNDVNSWILPFSPGDILNLRDIEQGLEVLQKVPNVDVKINIEPGSKAGESNILINTGRDKIWNLKTWLNNWGDKGTGKNLAGGSAYIYNLAKVNDLFYLSGATNTQHVSGGYNSISTYYTIPFGYWEYEVFYSKSKSRQAINIYEYNYKYTGISDYLSVKGSRTVYRDENTKIALSAELFKRKVDYKLEDVELELQKRNMTNAKFGVNYKQNFPGAVLDSSLTYQRFLPILGAVETSDMKSGDVSKKSHIANLNVNYTRALNLVPFAAYYNLSSGAQYSPGELTLQDQFTLGSRWNVRGFENSSGLYGNKGFYIQNTLNILTGVKGIEWYIGADYGYIWGDAYPLGEYSNKNLMGTTTGFRGNMSSLGYDVSLSAPVIYSHQLDVDKLNINFNLSYQI